jgi:riboflavin synthase
MFTGLIETTGTIVSLLERAGATRITISAPTIAPRLQIGDSVAVSGVCLTALDISLTQFSADLAEETLKRTTLSRLTPGYVVNLELPTPSGAPMGGHVVQGHVDSVGTLVALEPVDEANEATSDWRLRIAVPSNLSRYVASQGSITVDGISLTVAGVNGDVVSIAIIPHTYAATAISKLMPGSSVNIEVDVLAKYAERQTLLTPQPGPVRRPQWTVTEEYLLSNGY